MRSRAPIIAHEAGRGHLVTNGDDQPSDVLTVDVLVLCTGNRCRSQIAEGWLRSFFGERMVVASAGLSPSTVHPLAIQVMNEVGVDISAQTSKHVDELAGAEVGVVVTVCDSAAESCPTFPASTSVIHRSFPDPDHPELEVAEQLEIMRRARDEIGAWAKAFVAELLAGQET